MKIHITGSEGFIDRSKDLNTLTWKRHIGWFFKRKRVPRDVILIYHSVGGGPLSLSEKKFREQIVWLKNNACVVTLEKLLDSPNPGLLRVVLSFDDGYRTLYDTVYPTISVYNFPAIVYLNTGMLGTSHLPSNPKLGHYPGEHFLTWQEVGELVGQGWTAGGHGIDHVDLTKSSSEEIRRQLVGCKNQLEDKLGISCAHFAYTWGRYNEKARAAVAAAGFKTAVAALHGSVTKRADRLALPRIDICANYELKDFVAVVTGQWDFIGLKHRLMSVYA